MEKSEVGSPGALRSPHQYLLTDLYTASVPPTGERRGGKRERGEENMFFYQLTALSGSQKKNSLPSKAVPIVQGEKLCGNSEWSCLSLETGLAFHVT